MVGRCVHAKFWPWGMPWDPSYDHFGVLCRASFSYMEVYEGIWKYMEVYKVYPDILKNPPSLARSHARTLARSLARSIARSIARSLDRSLARSLARSSPAYSRLIQAYYGFIQAHFRLN